MPIDTTTYLVDISVGNDKIFTVPLKRAFEVVSGTVRISTTATVGNRTPRLEIRDENDDVIFTVDGIQSVAASQTDAAFGDLSIAAASDPTIVPILAPPGGSIRYLDFASIDAADTVEARLMVRVTRA